MSETILFAAARFRAHATLDKESDKILLPLAAKPTAQQLAILCTALAKVIESQPEPVAVNLLGNIRDSIASAGMRQAEYKVWLAEQEKPHG